MENTGRSQSDTYGPGRGWAAGPLCLSLGFILDQGIIISDMDSQEQVTRGRGPQAGTSPSQAGSRGACLPQGASLPSALRLDGRKGRQQDLHCFPGGSEAGLPLPASVLLYPASFPIWGSRRLGKGGRYLGHQRVPQPLTHFLGEGNLALAHTSVNYSTLPSHPPFFWSPGQ